jgi:nitroreductase
MEFGEVVRARSSIRKFKTTRVQDEDIKTLLEAARSSPSGLNL